MIHIGKPFITEEGDRALLRAKVDITDDTAGSYVRTITPERYRSVFLTDEDYPPAAWKDDGTLWFDVPHEFGRYLCTERSNTFVVALFWYAMVSGSDIEFEAPIRREYEDYNFKRQSQEKLEYSNDAEGSPKGSRIGWFGNRVYRSV